MAGIVTFFLITIIISIVDVRSMLKLKYKKEIIPYFVLMLLSGLVGFLYLIDPYRKSIIYLILAIFGIKG